MRSRSTLFFSCNTFLQVIGRVITFTLLERTILQDLARSETAFQELQHQKQASQLFAGCTNFAV